jgi:putative ABC transport system substrate-binding protein
MEQGGGSKNAEKTVKKKFMERTLSVVHSALCFLGALLLSQGLCAAMFLTLCSMLLAPCSSVHAQQAVWRIPRIGYLALGFPSPGSDALRQGLMELGHVEGETIIVERRSAEGKEDRLADLAAELVQLKVDVIVVGGTAAARAARRLTKTIPIVIPDSADPVEAELVASLSRPGGNVTGLTIMSPKLSGKRLELLKETFPTISSVVILVRKGRANYTPFLGTSREFEVTARSLDVKVESIGVRDDEIENVFSSMAKKRTAAFILNPNPMFSFQRERIVNAAFQSRVPGMYPHRGFVEVGGLMSYAANNADLFRRAAAYVDKILKGANPADLPVEQPTKFELVINLRAARQIGVTIPQAVLMWADEVIK